MDEQDNDKLFAEALESLVARLELLRSGGEYESAAVMASTAMDRLAHRLTEEQRSRIAAIEDAARLAQSESDRLEVIRLLSEVASSDEQESKAATTEIIAKGNRAVEPLLIALRVQLSQEDGEMELEGSIVSMLTQIAPELTAYPEDGSRAEKLAFVEQHLSSGR